MKLKDISKFENKQEGLDKFLEEFFSQHSWSERQSYIDEELEYDETNKVWMCYLAGIAERLGADFANYPPLWVNRVQYFCNMPMFLGNASDPSIREHLGITTPLEFSKRNLFFGGSLFKRFVKANKEKRWL